jgi:hypothetical protein
MASDIERLDGNAWRRGCKSFCPAPGEAARPRFLEERPRPLCTPRCPCRADPLYPVPHSVSASFTVWAWRTPTGLHLELGGPYLSFHQAFRCASATCGASATRRGSPFTIRGFYTPASVPAWLSVPLSPTVDFETVYPREATTDHGTMVQCRCGPCGRYTAQAWIPGATLPMCDPCRIAYTPGRGGRGHCHLHYPEITADPVTEVRLSAVVAWDWLVFLEAMLLSRSCELHTRGLCRWNITLIAEFAAGPPEAEMAVIDTAGTGLLQCGQSKRLADRQPDAWTYAPNEWKLCLATGPHSPPTHTHTYAHHTHPHIPTHAHSHTHTHKPTQLGRSVPSCSKRAGRLRVASRVCGSMVRCCSNPTFISKPSLCWRANCGNLSATAGCGSANDTWTTANRRGGVGSLATVHRRTPLPTQFSVVSSSTGPRKQS